MNPRSQQDSDLHDKGGPGDHNAHECLRFALAKLDEASRDLLLDYYAAEGSEKLVQRHRLASRLGISRSALRIRVLRTRLKVQSDVETCLENQQSTTGAVQIIPVIEQIKQLEPSLISHLKHHNDDLLKINPAVFEHLFAEFLAEQGFADVRLVGRNPNTSADIYATRHVAGPDIPVRLFVEVKRWKKTIGIEVINQVLGAYFGERERFGWNAALIVTVGGFKDFEKWSPEELQLKGLHLRDRNDLLRYLEGYKQHPNGLWLPNPRTDL